jgi:glutathione S-transferase
VAEPVSNHAPALGGSMETPMSEVTLYGFPRSVYVQMAGIVLTHHEVAYAFYDLETEMNTPAHLALHPFERVPILRHDDFTLYETGAIVGYVDEVFGSCRLTPSDPQLRARMSQWISAVNGYYYPYLIYHVSHERNVFPQLGIECRLWVQKGDDRRNAPQRARCADSGRSRNHDRTARFDP